MHQQPTPADVAERPMRSADVMAKSRFDAIEMLLRQKVDADTALDIAHWITTGELPEEAPDGD